MSRPSPGSIAQTCSTPIRRAPEGKAAGPPLPSHIQEITVYIAIICLIVALITALLVYIHHLRKDNAHYLAKWAETTVQGFETEKHLTYQIDELLKRDQVETYNALEQGMTELGESYEADRLDMEEKIERLEMERDFLLAQTEDVIVDLTERLSFMKRAQALHLETILSYQKDAEEKIKIPHRDCMGKPCKSHGVNVTVVDGETCCSLCGNILPNGV